MSNVSSSNSQGVRVPKLRFPGFECEWDSICLSNYLTENTNRNKNNLFSKNEVLSVSGEFGIVNQIEFQGRSFAGASVSDYHIVETNDIVYTKSPLKANPYGIIKHNSGVPGIVSTLYAVYHPLDSVIPQFVDYYFQNDLRLNKYLKPLVNIGAKHDMKVNNGTVLSGIVHFPKVNEQKKLVDFLTIINRRIEKQRQLVELLKSYKRGALSIIFQEDQQEAKIVKVGDITQSFSGGTPKSSIASYYGGHIPFIRSGELHQDYTELFLTAEGLNSSSAKLVQKGDLLYALYGATSGEVAISQIDGAINQAILCIRSETINTQYLAYWLEYRKKDILTRMLQGGQGNLSAELVKGLTIPMPPYNTQRERVNVLNMLSTQISRYKTILDSLSIYKSALLQYLFI